MNEGILIFNPTSFQELILYFLLSSLFWYLHFWDNKSTFDTWFLQLEKFFLYLDIDRDLYTHSCKQIANILFRINSFLEAYQVHL